MPPTPEPHFNVPGQSLSLDDLPENCTDPRCQCHGESTPESHADRRLEHLGAAGASPYDTKQSEKDERPDRDREQKLVHG